MAPGKTPKNNLMFLTFFVNTVKAVYNHADLLRSSIASVNNDHRLGANEAPPAIISIFLGEQLNEVLDEIESSHVVNRKKKDLSGALGLNIPKIPQILLDNTDRNRTSPFAFTGNKFEFRAVGSSANSAAPMTVLNAIVAEQLTIFKQDVDKLVKKGEKKDVAIMKIIRQYIKESKNIRFEGNGYSDEWAQEAAVRGLSNIKTTPKALDVLTAEKTVELYEKQHIFSERELHARHEIFLENYTKKIQIEARIMGDLVTSQIIPAALNYQTKLIENVRGLKDLGMNGALSQSQLEIITEISERVSTIKKAVYEMIEERKKANILTDAREMAIAYDEKVKSYFETIRYHVDKLELIIDDAQWPLPKFRELLFIK
ncbi:hypothetical protein D3C72_1136210 [compost metagenome]